LGGWVAGPSRKKLARSPAQGQPLWMLMHLPREDRQDCCLFLEGFLGRNEKPQ